MKNYLIVIILFTTILSCKKDDESTTTNNQSQEEIIMEYLVKTGLDSVAIRDSSGLYYVIEKQGTGDSIGSRTKGKAFYKGYYTDSTVFDESGGTPYGFELSQMIEGWQIGIPYFYEGATGTFNEGGEGILFVPDSLGYKDGKVRIFDIKIYKYY